MQQPGSRVVGHFPGRSERKAEILSRCHTDVSTFHSPNDPQLNLGSRWSDQGGAEYSTTATLNQTDTVSARYGTMGWLTDGRVWFPAC